ncbi:hypothetical protein [Salisaeta longa]|uniref:hypothetical protein n=1 Tax=Salisaeta longa TaxID=503170 RepID=UPI0003B3BA96|nr:hypothetical protein [Salisaeta longa]
MEKELQLLPILYNETACPEALANALADDPALRARYEAMQETKAHLDAVRGQHRPAPSVVDDVVARAGAVARDRQAAARRARPATERARPRRHRWMRATVAATALALLLGVGWWQWETEAPPARMTASTPPAPATEASLPAWDTSGEVQRLYHQAQQLERRSRAAAWAPFQPAMQPTTP